MWRYSEITVTVGLFSPDIFARGKENFGFPSSKTLNAPFQLFSQDTFTMVVENFEFPSSEALRNATFQLLFFSGYLHHG